MEHREVGSLTVTEFGNGVITKVCRSGYNFVYQVYRNVGYRVLITDGSHKGLTVYVDAHNLPTPA